MQVTHEEARKLIQFRLDAGLDPNQKVRLSDHLERCVECRIYAEDMKHVDRALAGASHKQREARFRPLSIPLLMEKSNRTAYYNSILAMRTTALVIACAALAFSTWSFFSVSQPPAPSEAPVGALPVPTPSGQSTSTKIFVEDCKVILYTVQNQDTLASIARRFSIHEEEVVALNNLKNGAIDSTQLWLPVCNSTPTGTAQGPATFTKTITPIQIPVTSTLGP